MESEEKRLAVRIFGGLADRLSPRLASLDEALGKSGMKILLRGYVSLGIMYALFVPAVSFFFSVFAFLLFFSPAKALVFSLLLSLLFFACSVVAVYLYPFHMADSRAKKIDAGLPFAINHMAAVASSGVPPYMVFKMLSSFSEYGEISKEASKIVSAVEGIGMDVSAAVKKALEETPSNQLKEFLQGFLSTLESGGDLRAFMETQARDSIFDYRIEREKYMESLATYADFYTAVLIVAPLFLIALLAVMGSVGGSISGISTKALLVIGIYAIIPAANTLFIAFIHLTQPEQV